MAVFGVAREPAQEPESAVDVCENLCAESPSFMEGLFFLFVSVLWTTMAWRPSLCCGLGIFSGHRFVLSIILCFHIFLFLCHASAVLIRVHMLLFFDSRIDVLLGSDLWHPAAGASARAHEGALRSRSAHL